MRSTTCCASVSPTVRRRFGPAHLRHLARRAPGRGRRARGAPVLRRLAVSPRVQVAPGAPGAAVPGLRRRPRWNASARDAAERRCRTRSSRRPCGQPRLAPSSGAGSANCSRSCVASKAHPAASAPAPSASLPSCAGWVWRCTRTVRGCRRALNAATCWRASPLVAAPTRAGASATSRPPRGHTARMSSGRPACCCAPTSTRSHPRLRSSRCCSTVDGRTPTRESSAPTTRPRWLCCWHSRGESSPRGRRWISSCCSPSARSARWRGRSAFDPAHLRSRVGYVFDHASPIGEIVIASPCHFRLDVEFRGTAAHAGVRPEEGCSAILAAARAVADMPLGRIDAQTTANVGRIEGGSAINVVPERCTLAAEVRSLREEMAEVTVAEIVDCVHEAANLPDCDCDVDVSVRRTLLGLCPPRERARCAGGRTRIARLRLQPHANLKRWRLRRQCVDRQGPHRREPGQRHRAHRTSPASA